MEKNILHALIISFIATSMIKLTYGIDSIELLIALNVLIMGGALYAYIRHEKTLVNERKQQEKLIEIATNTLDYLERKLDSMEKELLNGTEVQTKTIMSQFISGEGKLTELLDQHFSNGITQLKESIKVNELIADRLVALTAANNQSSSKLINQLVKTHELNAELKETAQEQIVQLKNNVTAEEATRHLIEERILELGVNQKELQSELKGMTPEIQKVTKAMTITEEVLSDDLTDLSDDLQRVLNNLNRRIEDLGHENSRISEDYQKLWQDLSKNLGETAFNNQQFLVLLQDHYKALKQVAVEI